MSYTEDDVVILRDRGITGFCQKHPNASTDYWLLTEGTVWACDVCLFDLVLMSKLSGRLVRMWDKYEWRDL